VRDAECIKDDGAECMVLAVGAHMLLVMLALCISCSLVLQQGVRDKATGSSCTWSCSTRCMYLHRPTHFPHQPDPPPQPPLLFQVVAFGMPLVFWGGARGHTQQEGEVSALDLPLVRVEHLLDPIPHFPAPVRALGFSQIVPGFTNAMYQPVGTRVSIGSREPPRGGAAGRGGLGFSGSLLAKGHSILGIRGVAAHRLRSYSAECYSILPSPAGQGMVMA
jgi:hypothetical protein